MSEEPEQQLPPMGRLAFEQYAESMEGFTHDGHGIPPWHALGEEVQHAWDQAARRLYVLGFTAGSKA